MHTLTMSIGGNRNEVRFFFYTKMIMKEKGSMMGNILGVQKYLEYV